MKKESKDHPVMVAAWCGFVQWFLGKEEFRKEFEKETGLIFVEPARGGLAALIDQDCGVDTGNKEYVRRFTIWVTENHWGEEEDIPEVFYRVFKRDNQPDLPGAEK